MTQEGVENYGLHRGTFLGWRNLVSVTHHKIGQRSLSQLSDVGRQDTPFCLCPDLSRPRLSVWLEREGLC
jgi:hypothetical protein